MMTDKYIRIVKGGTIKSTDLSNIDAWEQDAPKTWGDQVSQLWGENWLPSDINSSGFGVAISAQTDSAIGSPAMQIDCVSITVTYKLNNEVFLQHRYGKVRP